MVESNCGSPIAVKVQALDSKVCDTVAVQHLTAWLPIPNELCVTAMSNDPAANPALAARTHSGHVACAMSACRLAGIINHSGAKPAISGKNTRPYEKDDPPMAYAYPPTRIP